MAQEESSAAFTALAEELQIQEAHMASTVTAQMAKSASSSSPPASPPSRSSCVICRERRENDQMFKIESCIHSFCSDCINKHVATKVQGGIITRVTCPGPDCKSVLKFDACKSVLSKKVLELWEKALSQELIDASQGIYCPFKDCSAKLVYENDGEYVICESECPYCHRLFCAQCYVPWHPGVNCEEYQSLNDDERGREDLMMRELVKKKQLRKCPNCKYHIERTGGCLHMTCL
ncbi:hypothetical protein WN943_022851 [Citrus x changshan-huyou]